MLFYDLIINNLKHISLQTELLEACDWDEDKLNIKIQFIQNFLNEYKPANVAKWETLRDDIKNRLLETNDKTFTDIIIRVIDHHKDEFLQQLALGEN
jgi:hypothetical protein